jgi:guanylate kinase
MAPSLAVLRQRLMRRGLDSYGVIEKRMQNAQKEIDSRHLYRHTVVNDDLETSICEFIRILNGDDE